MDIQSARMLADELLTASGLTGWRVVIDRAKTRAGVCRYGARVIGLSGPLTALHSADEVRDTILHEIAHALVGPAHKHDAAWRAQAARLGCSARTCLPADAPKVPAPWVGTCPVGHTVQRHRRPERPSSCPRCNPAYSREHQFQWRFHGQEVALAADPCDAVLPVGSTVTITGAGRYFGAVGTVVKRGRTRYHVRLPEGLVAVPFPLAEPARERSDRRIMRSWGTTSS